MSRISDLMLRKGEAEGQRAGARALGRANLISSVAGFLPGVRNRQAANADADRQRRIDESRFRADDAQTRNAEDAIRSRQQGEWTEAQQRVEAQKVAQFHDWLAEIASAQDPEIAKAAYEAKRPQLIQAGVISEQDVPAFFPGLSWVKGAMMRALPAKERIAQMFPEPEKPQGLMNVGGRVFDPNSREVVYEPPAEAKPPADQEWVIRGGKVTPIAKGTRQQGDQPYQPPTQAQPRTPDQQWVIRNGKVTPIPRGTAQPGDQPYDEVAARQQYGAADPQAEAVDTAQEVVRIATALRDSPGFAGAFGVVSSRMPTMRQGTADAEVLLNSLRSLLTLENTGKLKGVLSNADMELLRQASSTLSAQMSEPAAKAELTRLIQVMGRVAGATGGRMTNAAPAADPLGIR